MRLHRPAPHSGLFRVGPWLRALEQAHEVKPGFGLDQAKRQHGARSARPVGKLAQVLGVRADLLGDPVKPLLPVDLQQLGQRQSGTFASSGFAHVRHGSKFSLPRLAESSEPRRVDSSETQVSLLKAARYAQRMDIVSIRKLRLNEAVKEAGGVARLAEISGVNEKYLRQILAGFRGKKDKKPRSVGPVIARRIEAALNKKHGWMDSLPPVASLPQSEPPSVGTSPDSEQISGPPGSDSLSSLRPPFSLTVSQLGDVVPVPILTSTNKGHALAAEDAVTGAMLLSREWIRLNVPGVSQPENLAAIPAANDSMSPTFTTGDVLLVDRGVDRVRADGVYAIVIGDELFIKRLQRQISGGVLVISDNERYSTQALSEADMAKVKVAGRVMCSWNLNRL